MNRRHRLAALVGPLILLVLAGMVVAQVQNQEWQSTQQNFDLRTAELVQEHVRLISVQSPETPLKIRLGAFFTHWYAWASHQNDQYDRAVACWLCESDTSMVTWNVFHSTVVTGHIMTVYYWEPMRASWFDVSAGCFYAVDGTGNIYIFLGWSEQ